MQTLYLGEYLDYTLLCPNQLCHHGITVDDVPRHLATNPDSAMHSIFIPEDEISIPLEMKGVISCFQTRTPTPEEIENCKWLILISELDWIRIHLSLLYVKNKLTTIILQCL
jgi:hypothetical protein